VCAHRLLAAIGPTSEWPVADGAPSGSGNAAVQGNDRPNQPDNQNYSSSKKHKTKMTKEQGEEDQEAG
jgi:hypothetical protein